MGTKLLDLWRGSSLIQGVMALGATGAIIYLAITGREIPELLAGLVMAIVGYYFGTKQSLSARG